MAESHFDKILMCSEKLDAHKKFNETLRQVNKQDLHLLYSTIKTLTTEEGVHTAIKKRVISSHVNMKSYMRKPGKLQIQHRAHNVPIVV